MSSMDFLYTKPKGRHFSEGLMIEQYKNGNYKNLFDTPKRKTRRNLDEGLMVGKKNIFSQRCPKGTRKNSIGECVKKCPKGQRRSRKTGECGSSKKK